MDETESRTAAVPPVRKSSQDGVFGRVGSTLNRWWHSPSRVWLWSLTILTGVISAAAQQRADVAAFLQRHNFGSWLLSPFGIPLVAWWAGFFLLNELWLRAAASGDRHRWMVAQRRMLDKVSGTIDVLIRILRDDAGRLTEEHTRAAIRSLLARTVEYAALFVNRPDAEFRACCLLVREREHETGPARYVEAWEYDAPHRHAYFSKVLWGDPLAGLVAARRETLVIDDTTARNSARFFPNRRYRSTIGYPLVIGGPEGALVGVVTIDATVPRAFSGNVGAELENALGPILGVISLALSFQRSGGRRGRRLPAPRPEDL